MAKACHSPSRCRDRKINAMKKHKNPHPWKSAQSAAGREKRDLEKLLKQQKEAKIDHLTEKGKGSEEHNKRAPDFI